MIKILEHTIVCKYLHGRQAINNETFALPRVRFEYGGIPSEPGMKWARTQFPIRPSMAMTIGKAQGQTLDKVGLDLFDSQCFSHGHLYTALSRVRSMDSVRIYSKGTTSADGKTRNIVRNVVVPEILENGLYLIFINLKCLK